MWNPGLTSLCLCEHIHGSVFMNVVQIYRCFCDKTRLRILHLLKQGPLCVCHVQEILQLPQVTVSKHLACLRRTGMVEARRHEQWVIYSLPASPGRELDLQLSCLQDCVQSYPEFRADLRRLKALGTKCNWVPKALEPSAACGQANRPSTRLDPPSGIRLAVHSQAKCRQDATK